MERLQHLPVPGGEGRSLGGHAKSFNLVHPYACIWNAKTEMVWSERQRGKLGIRSIKRLLPLNPRARSKRADWSDQFTDVHQCLPDEGLWTFKVCSF